jgi:lipopolysaccharide export system protein LptA
LRNSNRIITGFKFNARTLAGLLAATIALNPTIALAQDMMAPSSGPIDIVADEQEFGEDRVIARGKVKVVHGDTIIRAPVATLFRDEAGQPKMAIFTGSPTLVQGNNSIRANKLTFDIKAARILAEGNAHSEVLSNSMGGGDKPAEPGAGKGKPAAKQPPKQLNPDDEIEPMPPDDDAQNDDPKDPSPNATPPKAQGESKPQKIITDSDKQEFERNSGKFEAHGNVRVVTQGINVRSNHLRLVYGTDQKAEAVVFTGDVTAKRDANVTQADVMTYFLTTQRLQATGHVKSRVVQEKAAGPKKGGLQVNNSSQTGGMMGIQKGGGEEIIIMSDAQDYNKDTGRVDAEGRVRLYYGSTTGIGPKISIVANEFGETEKVVFIGRSQITQPGRRWIADRITYTVEDNKVLAEGNTRAIIVKGPQGAGPAPKAAPPTVPSSRLADDGRNKTQ